MKVVIGLVIFNCLVVVLINLVNWLVLLVCVSGGFSGVISDNRMLIEMVVVRYILCGWVSNFLVDFVSWCLMNFVGYFLWC